MWAAGAETSVLLGWRGNKAKAEGVTGVGEGVSGDVSGMHRHSLKGRWSVATGTVGWGWRGAFATLKTRTRMWVRWRTHACMHAAVCLFVWGSPCTACCCAVSARPYLSARLYSVLHCAIQHCRRSVGKTNGRERRPKATAATRHDPRSNSSSSSKNRGSRSRHEQQLVVQGSENAGEPLN